MLSALEIDGFKSFADAARFEFPAGVTAVVGPNGSGKSNVVDAIKWVLGSQSLKALRGKETTDVIFSGSQSRRAANAAEVSLIFDNATGLLDHDAQQVQITRRLYRSGESEYLINRQPSRLRDIRDLLAGSGLAGGAYSIIEQGKVDAVLQSSPKERRAIFEEAAGVSRFRVKREEAARRMERVEQNLLRLSDVVQELQNRLKTVRSQAGRAQRYSELTSRLKLLRTELARRDWRQATQRRLQLQGAVAAQEEAQAALETEAATYLAAVADGDRRLDELQAAAQATAADWADVREQAALLESTRGGHLARVDELTQEIERLSRQVAALSTRAGDAQALVAETDADLAASTAHLVVQQTDLQRLQQAVAEAERTLADARREQAQRLGSAEHSQRELERWGGERGQAAAEVLAADAAAARCQQQAGPLLAQRTELSTAQQRADDAVRCRHADLAEAARIVAEGQQSVAELRRRLNAAQDRRAAAAGDLAAARERIQVLEELERQLDGLTAGAKDVLHRARLDPAGPFGCVQGVVADLLNVDADTATLIETALGERAGYLVVTDAHTLEPALAAEPAAWAGRTSFLRLDVPPPASAVDRIDLAGEAGVMGRADCFVDAAPNLQPLVRRLLGRTWLVDSLATALRLSGEAGRGLNFVTAAGETVLADGAVSVGPRPNLTGALSRRSELRALGERIGHLTQHAADSDAACGTLHQQLADGEQQQQVRVRRHAEALHQHADARLAAASLAERLQQLDARLAALDEERSAAIDGVNLRRQELADGERRAAELQTQLADLRTALDAGATRIDALSTQRDEVVARLADCRVLLARSEQRVEGLRKQQDQLRHDHAERDRTLAETSARAAECLQQQRLLREQVAHIESQTARLQDDRQRLGRLAHEQEQALDAARRERAEAVEAEQRIRRRLLQQQRQAHAAKLDLEHCRDQVAGLAERVRDELQIDPESLACPADEVGPTGPTGTESVAPNVAAVAAADRETIEREVRRLREELASAGPVNLEAVAELESLEQRQGGLIRRYEDLEQARTRLKKIISQLNGESRELFVRTVDEVRGHFQEMFSQLFGGGEADVVIEADDGGDVLECGVSIVARPPGKQPRSISLLSGGERTMTCVALLLAIFRSRPSPFCVLDEVDAALDEANVERFAEMLKQFMRQTQFIVVTHSKRTMACAETLYGVTMQESGVSKRVAVRFEEVADDGQIADEALRRPERSEAAPSLPARAA